MPSKQNLPPSPFFLEGGPTGVLLIHGFTGSPKEMRLLGGYLNERGLTVSGPSLPGHCTTADELNEVCWQDWTHHLSVSLADLQLRCETVYVAGLSMGAVLSLYLAALHPELAGIVAYAPALIVADRRRFLAPLAPVLKFFKPHLDKPEDENEDPEVTARYWSYETYPTGGAHELVKLQKKVKRMLPDVTVPLLIVHSSGDLTVHDKSADYIYEHAGSADKELVTIHDSGHVLVVDAEWEDVAERTYQFIQRVGAGELEKEK